MQAVVNYSFRLSENCDSSKGMTQVCNLMTVKTNLKTSVHMRERRYVFAPPEYCKQKTCTLVKIGENFCALKLQRKTARLIIWHFNSPMVELFCVKICYKNSNSLWFIVKLFHLFSVKREEDYVFCLYMKINSSGPSICSFVYLVTVPWLEYCLSMWEKKLNVLWSPGTADV